MAWPRPGHGLAWPRPGPRSRPRPRPGLGLAWSGQAWPRPRPRPGVDLAWSGLVHEVQYYPLLSTIIPSHAPGKSMGAPNPSIIIHDYPISFFWKKVWAPQIRRLLSTIIQNPFSWKKVWAPQIRRVLSTIIQNPFSWKKVWAQQNRPFLSQ